MGFGSKSYFLAVTLISLASPARASCAGEAAVAAHSASAASVIVSLFIFRPLFEAAGARKRSDKADDTSRWPPVSFGPQVLQICTPLCAKSDGTAVITGF